MHRAYSALVLPSLPAVPAGLVTGYPVSGDPGSNTPASIIGGHWHLMVTEELMSIVAAAGLTPNHANYTQVLSAIQSLIASGANRQILPLTASVGSNALTVGIPAGALSFRNTTLANGSPNIRTFGAPLALIVPSGASLGSVNGIASRLAVLAIDNGGTVEAAIVGLSSGFNLDESRLINTTTIGAGATTPGVVYSSLGRTGVPFRVVGFIESTQATAGTWASAPSLVQGAGGTAMTALMAFGAGQTYTDVSGSRASATTYYNTTGKPISVVLGMQAASGSPGITIAINGQQIWTGNFPYGTNMYSFIVPPGASYVVTEFPGTTRASWLELR